MNYREKYHELIERLENVSDALIELNESSIVECPNCGRCMSDILVIEDICPFCGVESIKLRCGR